MQEWGTRQAVVLADANVAALYPHFFDALSDHFTCRTITIPGSESSKTIEQAVQVWQQLQEWQMERNDTLIMFGGGMVCDLGGFVAATYKRGIHGVYCPTTLLSMIDAAYGGKTAVNLHHVKNCIGVVRQPDYVMPANTTFLQTLPMAELKSGFGEMIKYELIASPLLLKQINDLEVLTPESVSPLWIQECVRIKENVVRKDPNDHHERHVLNFGHTIGHAIEGYYAASGRGVPHGVAVAAGLLYESFLSEKLTGLPHNEFLMIENLIQRHFKVKPFSKKKWNVLLPYLIQDKKNKDGRINFTLLKGIGSPVTDVLVQDYPF